MEHGFTRVTSSPRYPQAHGEAEWSVAAIKGLWKRRRQSKGAACWHIALHRWRATPQRNSSWEEKFAPTHQLPAALRPRGPNTKGFRRSEKQAKEKQQRRFNLRQSSLADEGQVRRNRTHMRSVGYILHQPHTSLTKQIASHIQTHVTSSG